MKFDQYPISEEIKNNLSRLGFKRPTDIQYKSIPSIMNGEDVLAVAQTGTGKTAAFAIPLVDKIQRKKKSRRSGGIQALVMVPTRELAQQIGEVMNRLSAHTRVNAFSLHGGIEQDPQIRRLQDGIDILIATPGRMFDLISQGFLKLDRVETLVLDEADRMLDLGFIEDIQSVKRKLPNEHQTLFFSATFNREIKKMAYSQVKSNAIHIQISPDDPVSRNVSHFVMDVEMDDKRFFLERFIQDHPDSKVLVFVRTRVRAERVTEAMKRVGIQVSILHGEKDQAGRTEILGKFKMGVIRILISTDVTARGIDIPDVDYVINYDLPEQPEYYVHRVGRTGRGVRKGTAISFCSQEEKKTLEEIQKTLKKPIEKMDISRKDYAAVAALSGTLKDLKAVMVEHEEWEMKQRRKRKSKGVR